MGTSVSQGSPRTNNWLAAQATYRNQNFPIERVLQEVWRAATNQPEGDLAAQLAQPVIERVREIAMSGASVLEIATAVNRELAQSRQPSLAADIARRAAIQCAQAQDRAQTYNERLFAEASNYLVARDLPGFVGVGGRNQNVADAHHFKQTVMEAAVNAVRDVHNQAPDAAKDWGSFTSLVVDRLRRRSE